MSQSRILMVSLGGTITMTRDASGGIVPTLTAADLIASVLGIERVAAIETHSPLRKPGASLTMDDLIGVAKLLRERLAGDIDGAVIIQGTDTIEETAFVLDSLIDSDKPVIVTGAMRGPETAGSDGPANVLASVITASAAGARGRGTLVVLNDEIHAAWLVQKSHTALTSAFRSPLSGPVGLVIEGEAVFHARTPRRPVITDALSEQNMQVALVTIALGDDGRLLRAVPSFGYAGVVLDGMGAGHVPASFAPVVSDLLKDIPVVLASRVDTGPVFARTYGFPGSEIDLRARGVISAGNLSGLKARLLLTLALRAGWDRDRIAAVFSPPANSE
jgi:L-asparaginase